MTRYRTLGLAALLALACAPLARAQGPEAAPTRTADGAEFAPFGIFRPRPRPAPPATDVQEGARAYYLGIPIAHRQVAASVRAGTITSRETFVDAIDRAQREAGAAYKKAMNAVLDGYCDQAGNITNPGALATVLESAAAAMEAAK